MIAGYDVLSVRGIAWHGDTSNGVVVGLFVRSQVNGVERVFEVFPSKGTVVLGNALVDGIAPEWGARSYPVTQ